MKNYNKEGVSSIEEAELILREAEMLNLGQLVQHSRYVAEGARLILEIQKYFEDKIGKSIYSILPGVVEIPLRYNLWYNNLGQKVCGYSVGQIMIKILCFLILRLRFFQVNICYI